MEILTTYGELIKNIKKITGEEEEIFMINYKSGSTEIILRRDIDEIRGE